MVRIDETVARNSRPPSRSVFLGLAATFLVVGAAAGPATASADAPKHQATQRRAVAQLAQVTGLPLNFERNLGQAPADVQYLAHGRAYAIALSKRGATLSLSAEGAAAAGRPDVIDLQVRDATGTRNPNAEAPLPGRINYFVGNDPAKWLTNVATYGKVRYRGVYPGVDLVYYGTEGKLEYDFAVAPHASTGQIGLAFAGADGLELDSSGALQVKKGERAITFERPYAYQLVEGRKQPVPAHYRVDGNVIRFQLGAYDHSQALIIDPVLSYFSYLGGSNVDVIGATLPQQSQVSGQAAAVDSAGGLYVAGYTASTNFPTQAAYAAVAPAKTSGSNWAFVTRFAPDAKSLVFSTYVGGTTGNDYGFGIALDQNGNAFVAGETGSSDFPTTSGAYLRVCSPDYVNSPNNPFSGCGNGNGYESFIAKFSPTGTLLASTFLGGTHTLSSANAVAIDSRGRPYVAGSALPGENIPVGIGGTNEQVGFQTTPGAVLSAYNYIAGVPINGTLQSDAYVSVFDSSLGTLLYSTLIGDDRPQNGTVQFTSQANTLGTAVAVDGAGNFYLTGYTGDTYLPTTAGSVQSVASSCGNVTAGTPNSFGGECGFVAKFSPVGTTGGPVLTYLTYLGGQATAAAAGHGNWGDLITGIVPDASGDAYVVGYTNQAGFPTTSGAYQTTCDGYDNTTSTGDYDCGAVFIAELNPGGSRVLASTYFGCITCSSDSVSTVGAIVLDGSNNVYVSGLGGNSLPVVNGFASNDTNAGGGIFVAELDSALTTLKLSTFVNSGNPGQLSPGGLALDSSGAIYVAGNVNVVSTSAATNGAFQTTYGGGSSDGFVAKITVTPPGPVTTTTALSASSSAVVAGTSVTFTATVTPTSGSGVPTGSVTFKNGSATLGTGTLNSTGVATFATSALPVGTTTVTATYGGDTGDAASTSMAVSVAVAQGAPTGLTATAGNASITLSWTAVSGATSYNIYQGTSAGGESSTPVMTVNSGTTATISSLTNGTTYYFTVTAVGGGVTSSASSEVSAMPTAPSSGSSGSGGSGGNSGTGGSTSSGGSGHGGGGAYGIWELICLALAGFWRGVRSWL